MCDAFLVYYIIIACLVVKPFVIKLHMTSGIKKLNVAKFVINFKDYKPNKFLFIVAWLEMDYVS